MVTKRHSKQRLTRLCLILAKNHMVTKQTPFLLFPTDCLILAKNHMVTKPQIHVTIYLKIIKY